MKRSTERIRTTHTGSLPRPPELLETMRAIAEGRPYDREVYEAAVKAHVAEVVRKQVQAGIDVVNDGETSKPSFQAYVAERLEGFEARMPPGGLPVPTGPMGVGGRDATAFPDFYEYVLAHNPFLRTIRMAPRVCVAPIRYAGRTPLQRDIANLKQAMAAWGAHEGFMPALAPISGMGNEHYRSEEEFQVAYGDAMREEYQAILDAGLLLQIDYPALVSSWDARRSATLTEYRKWMQGRVELINHALRGLPEDRIRFHTCYGVNFGPRVSDLQLGEVIDIFYRIGAGAYSFEAANPRHDHEWRVPQVGKLPEGKILIPGAVTHSNVMVEHPEVVADRMERWACAAGRENVIFGNDCGFQSTAGNEEIPVSVAWAKLAALGEGARIASKRLWC
ncbi:MAG: cobalamin-independent methionine synthase II family protein [Burkholderiales bacterium]|nr:cobalamin-independent methionine synthase II family protein [Burkholderiales bacterium]